MIAMEEKKPPIEIQYSLAKFHRRVLANLLDFLIFVAMTVALFLSARAIVNNNESYREKANTLRQYQLESSLYKEKNEEMMDIVSFLNSGDLTGIGKKEGAIEAINSFFTFAEKNVDTKEYSAIKSGYLDYVKKLDLSLNGVPYFLFADGDVVENEACSAAAISYFQKAYSPCLSDLLTSYFLTKIPGVMEITSYQAMIVIFAEALPSYALAGLLVYLVPPLCFYHTRYTLGKALYRIGLANSDLLSVSLKKFLLRFAIFYFGELLLSVATFAIPFLISTSLMAFSKRRQGFPDYLLGLFEVDLSSNRLYRSYDEIRLNQLNPSKKSVDFRMITRG